MPILDVQWLLPDGRAGGRAADGQTVRLRGAIPGDRVRFTPQKTRGRTVDATLDEIVAPSPDRRDPSCPWHEACGGCDLATMTPDSRRASLAKIAGRGLGVDTPEMIPSPRQTAHRARIDLGIVDGRVGYRRSRSDELVEIDACLIARPEVQAALERLRHADLTGFTRVEIRSDGTRAVYAFTGGRRDATLSGLEDIAIDGKFVRGNPRLELDVNGIRLQASPRSFYQVNLEINALLAAEVATAAADHERVLDLYAGIGNLSLPIAATGTPVVAVELPGQALSDLRAQSGSLPVEAIGADVERFDISRVAFDCLILDPPRAGAAGVLKRVALNRPRTVIYVSCNVQSAARDLRELGDYRIARTVCFEMFPDTHHFETLIVLKRA